MPKPTSKVQAFDPKKSAKKIPQSKILIWSFFSYVFQNIYIIVPVITSDKKANKYILQKILTFEHLIFMAKSYQK